MSKYTPTKLKHKGLHSRNCHRAGYDFPALLATSPNLKPYVHNNTHGNLSIDFADPLAVKALNTALLAHHYHIQHWDIPAGALCPPIPGRVDYIHYIAELLDIAEPNTDSVDKPSEIKLLDIGTGANGIYSLLACQVYGWTCVASDINSQSLANVATIIANNPQLNDRLTLRLQPDKNHIFTGIIQPDEQFDVSVCNPPFHASLEEAIKGSRRKVDNLARNRREQVHTHDNNIKPTLNFGGQENELWCKGGEQLFLKKMIKESQAFSGQCRWFTSLVSKAENVKPAIKLLRKLGASDVREIDMVQGNKMTRIVAWTFLS
jgi:23S rRNA (adenine1618-N6)-methyltransferase